MVAPQTVLARSPLVWLVVVIKDVGSAMKMIVAALRLSGSSTKARISEDHIESLSLTRSLWFCSVQLARIVIALCLGYGGARALSININLEGLLR